MDMQINSPSGMKVTRIKAYSRCSLHKLFNTAFKIEKQLEEKKI